LALARARRLGRVRGITAGRPPDVVADRVPEGFAMLVSAPGPDGEPRSIACFDGLDAPPDAAGTALAMRLDRVVVPAEGIARRFRELWPDARAHVSLVSYPLAAQWPVAVDSKSLRARQRDRLGLPDRTRLVLGIGRAGSGAGLARFAALATRCCELRNDVRFVWMGARKPDWERAHWLAVGLPVAMRRLFLVEDENLAAWLTAADAYIGCRSPDVHDPAAVEAMAAGLPVCVASLASLPDSLRAAPCAGRVDAASGEAAIDWLADRVPALNSGVPSAEPRLDPDIAACLGGRELLKAFDAACLRSD
jgi:glycosyltransferase involved in cell wall biosynthesis